MVREGILPDLTMSGEESYLGNNLVAWDAVSSKKVGRLRLDIGFTLLEYTRSPRVPKVGVEDCLKLARDTLRRLESNLHAEVV